MEIDTQKLKDALLKEQELLESELASVGKRNPDNPDDWEPTQGDASGAVADPNEKADAFEQYEERAGILKQLETRYNNVKIALKKLDEGGYGICEISGEPIEADRLEANPAARTNKANMDKDLPVV